jgi:two-component system KDP operon response regulator KdpE
MARDTVLVVDDDAHIQRALGPTLSAEGYAVVVARTGADALAQMAATGFSVIILDLGLPDMDGKAVIQRALAISGAPIIVLSARASEDEKIAALDLGAEDYLQKPFSVGELLARLRVLMRSTRLPARERVVEIGDVTFDFHRRRASMPWGEARLSGKENEFLRLLCARRGDVLTHREIIRAIWGDASRADAQFVRVLVGQVRQKVEEDPSRPRLVLTVSGIGYELGK